MTASTLKGGGLGSISDGLKWQRQIQFDDGNRQILLIKGQIMGQIWMLVGVYAPHSGKEEFLENLIKKIEQYWEGNLTLLGGFNSVMDESEYKSTKTSFHSGFPRIF